MVPVPTRSTRRCRSTPFDTRGRPICSPTFLPHPVRGVVLPLLVVELVKGNPVALRERFHPFTKPLRDPAQQDRRGNRLLQLLPDEGDRPSRCRQSRDIAVEIQPIDAFDFQEEFTKKFRAGLFDALAQGHRERDARISKKRPLLLSQRFNMRRKSLHEIEQPAVHLPPRQLRLPQRPRGW